MNTKPRRNLLAFTFMMGAFGATMINTNACGEYYGSRSKQCSPGLKITGRAEKTVKSDRAVFNLTLSVSGDCYKELLQKLNDQIKELKQFWIQMGVKPDMIHVDNRTNIRISDLEYGSDKKKNKYSIQCGIVLSMDDVEMAPEVQNKTNTLVEKGFVFSEQNISYVYSKAAELQRELTKQALIDGQKTAQENAAALGLSIEKTPHNIGRSNLGCASTYDNPSPYERGWCSSTNIENKFTVLVDMYYSFKKNDDINQKTPEKTDQKAQTAEQG